MLALRKERGEGRGSVASLKEKAARDRGTATGPLLHLRHHEATPMQLGKPTSLKLLVD
jgi:hypothetical protein